jgi:hypothetical protein
MLNLTQATKCRFRPSGTCQEVSEPTGEFARRIVTRNVGPFKVRGYDLAVDSSRASLRRCAASAQMSWRHNPDRFSNHSWGPLGENPLVMTDSHNLGFKASSANDDNLVILEGNAPLAVVYAMNIIAIFQNYHLEKAQERVRAKYFRINDRLAAKPRKKGSAESKICDASCLPHPDRSLGSNLFVVRV